MSPTAEPVNIVSAASGKEPSVEAGIAERSGTAIIELLTQAANAAKQNEARARQLVQQLTQALRSVDQLNAALEERAKAAERRAIEAEEWIVHIYREANETLLGPLVDRSGEK